MKFISAILASLLIAQAFGANIPTVFEDEDMTADECIEAVSCIAERLNETEFEIEAEDLVIVEIINIIVNMVQGYLDCEAILSDPPSRGEELQHSACMTRWRISAAANAIRLRILVANGADNVRNTWAEVQDQCTAGRPLLPCLGHLVENPDSTEIAPY